MLESNNIIGVKIDSLGCSYSKKYEGFYSVLSDLGEVSVDISSSEEFVIFNSLRDNSRILFKKVKTDNYVKCGNLTCAEFN